MVEHPESQAPIIKRAFVHEENSEAENSDFTAQKTSVDNQTGASSFLTSMAYGASLSLPHLNLVGAASREVCDIARDAATAIADALFDFAPPASGDEIIRRVTPAGDVNAVNPSKKEESDKDDQIRVRRTLPNAQSEEFPNAYPDRFRNAYPDEFPNAHPNAYNDAYPNVYMDPRKTESGDKAESSLTEQFLKHWLHGRKLKLFPEDK
ncbi:MAG: hypothetical protein C0507_17700 [Cyanobacteria bacterium PR.3.49]|nr:hypothetical protein [Cyanobacteria bacterium PR.3.49]